MKLEREDGVEEPKSVTGTGMSLAAPEYRTLLWMFKDRSRNCSNGLLRQYFPTGTDLSVLSPERLLEVATELNNRPRKTLGGSTPAQVMQRLLSEPEKPIVATTG
jgi:hypothetical protein